MYKWLKFNKELFSPDSRRYRRRLDRHRVAPGSCRRRAGAAVTLPAASHKLGGPAPDGRTSGLTPPPPSSRGAVPFPTGCDSQRPKQFVGSHGPPGRNPQARQLPPFRDGRAVAQRRLASTLLAFCPAVLQSRDSSLPPPLPRGEDVTQRGASLLGDALYSVFASSLK